MQPTTRDSARAADALALGLHGACARPNELVEGLPRHPFPASLIFFVREMWLCLTAHHSWISLFLIPVPLCQALSLLLSLVTLCCDLSQSTAQHKLRATTPMSAVGCMVALETRVQYADHELLEDVCFKLFFLTIWMLMAPVHFRWQPPPDADKDESSVSKRPTVPTSQLTIPSPSHEQHLQQQQQHQRGMCMAVCRWVAKTIRPLRRRPH